MTITWSVYRIRLLITILISITNSKDIYIPDLRYKTNYAALWYGMDRRQL